MPSQFQPFKAVAIDLDGTLLGPDLSISAANRAAIESLHANGVHVILASGRHYASMLPYARTLPQVEYMVSSQGAFASDVEKKTILFESYLSSSDAKETIEFGLANGLSIAVYTESGIATLSEGKWIEYYSNLAGINPVFSTPEEVMDDPIFKILFFESAARLDEIQESEYAKNSPHYTVRSLENIFETAHAKTSKRAALQALIDHLRIPATQLATFGDGNNDIPMFEMAGFSCAMDHAWPKAKQAATTVATDGDPAASFARGVDAMRAHANALSS